ncbi:MAG: DUF1573 domain-containing protein [Verrucomicrobiota bacterium]
MKTALFIATLWTGGWCIAALAEGAPKIQFDQTVYDFGKTSQVATVSGVFKFKNAGDGILKVEPPKPSCGCTVAEVKPNTLPPGATGELPFTLNLGLSRATLEKHIAVRSNDPQTPEVSLTIKADYTPLYDLNPMMLAPKLEFGVNETNIFITITRTDGKPLRLVRLDASKPWITATVEPGAKADDATARIRVTIQRDEPPRRFNEFVQVYAAEQTNTPVSSIYLYGQVMGEVSLSPEALYWSITDATNTPAERPEAQITQRVTIRSAAGQTIELKNPQSTIKDIKVELVPKEAGKVYELVARLDEVPASTVSGNVSFETSVAAQPRIEVPVIVNVFKP